MWFFKKLLSYAIVIALYSAVTHCEPYYRSKPWPSYSLQNMPQTQFTCHDKILGGYYADSETQCQMFHICVKVAGVGVQDFRFLCPNGTAFDQEAQICADWGDVDCEQSVLYYGSDNFDLYRIGSGLESKRAPLAEEEESTFHLQRAESSDIKRTKETRIDQKFRPDQPPNYSRQFEATVRNSKKNIPHLDANTNTNSKLNQKARIETTTKTPIVHYYTPTTTTTTTTTEKYFNHDESKQEYDDIFKGSHSSHFFANRNGGREDDFIDHPARGSPNDFSDYSKKAETSTIGKTRVQTTRSRRPITSTSSQPSFSTTLAPLTSTTKKLTLQTFFSANYFGFSPSTSNPSITTTVNPFTSIPTTSRTQTNNRFKLKTYDYQENIQPTTYNPGNNKFRFKTTTAKYPDISKNKYDNYEKSKLYSKPTIASRNQQTQEISKLDFEVKDNKFNNKQKDINNFQKIKNQQPHPFQPSQIFRAPPVSPKVESIQSKPAPVDAQSTRLRSQPLSPVRTNNNNNNNKNDQNAFVNPQRQRGTTTEKIKTTTVSVQSPRGFTSRGSINYKTSTQKAADINAQTFAQNYKKFSTLVPKDQYTTPTTFKPTSKNLNDYNIYQTPQTTITPRKTQKPVTISSTQSPTTANPYYNPDEDDGQYHPELYEVDYTPKNHYNLQRSSITSTSSTTTAKPYKNNFNNPQTHLKTQQLTALQKQQQQNQQEQSSADLSDEDELFKTAQSLNFGAASINKLRADIIKAERTSQQYNSQYSPNAQTPDTVIATTASGFSLPPNPTSQPYITSKPYQQTSTVYTTIRPVATSTTIATRNYDNNKSNKASAKPTKSTGLGKKPAKKLASKRPPHADEDTSYDYAYYDSDTLSESPQDYPEYRIEEFSKTRKN